LIPLNSSDVLMMKLLNLNSAMVVDLVFLLNLLLFHQYLFILLWPLFHHL
jgi:hypothetical protein